MKSMDLFEKELNLDLLHLNNYIQTKTDLLVMQESMRLDYNMYEGVYTEVSASSIMNKIKDVFKKIIETIRKIIDKIIKAAQTKIQQVEVNKKLKEIKEKLANMKIDPRALKDVKKEYPNTKAYIKDYKKYINELVKGYKDIYHQDFEEGSEYEKEIKYLEKSLAVKYKKMLNCKEREILTSNVKETIELTEKEMKNYERTVKEICKISEDAVEELADEVEDDVVEITEESTLMVEETKPPIYKARIMQGGSQSITKTTKKVAKIVAFHPIEILLFFSSKFDLWWDDKKYRKIKGEIEDAYNREMKRQQFNKDEIMRKVYKQHTGEDMNV